jgi:hypothetical protein
VCRRPISLRTWLQFRVRRDNRIPKCRTTRTPPSVEQTSRRATRPPVSCFRNGLTVLTDQDNIDPTGMATAAMNRGYPPMYTNPQSASPASVQSPQHDHHQRPMYQQPMYAGYPPYSVPAQSPYGQHPVQPAPPMNANFIPQQQGQPMPQHQAHQVPPAMAGSPDVKIQQSQIQRQTPGMATPGAPPGTPGSATGIHHSHHAGSSTNPNAAPGPIPATTPLVVRQDQNGVQWIAFEYSRDRVKMEYTIRCDVESIDVNGLTQDFKTENCVYPRACCPKDQYKGNRLHYESECNTVGWALAQLNPCLRGKRGLIQRAVDSWRNSNQDPRLRSRRVRRMAKINNRTKGGSIAQQQHATHMATAGAPGAPGVAPPGMPAPGPRQPGMQMGGQLIHHHHEQPGGGPPGGTDDVSGMFHHQQQM